MTDDPRYRCAPGLPFTLLFAYLEHGWLEARVAADGQALPMWVSYLSDAPRELLDAVIALISGADRATVAWEEEPGKYRWLLSRQGEDVRVQIVWFADSFSRRLNEVGAIRFDAICPLQRLATQVKGQMHRLLNEHGTDEYKRRWHYDFPLAAFERLSGWIAEQKAR